MNVNYFRSAQLLCEGTILYVDVHMAGTIVGYAMNNSYGDLIATYTTRLIATTTINRIPLTAPIDPMVTHKLL